MQTGTLVLLALIVAVGSTHAAPRTWYTEAKLDIMRSKLAKHEWARNRRASIFAAADRWAQMDDERLRTLVIPPSVPRAYDIHNLGCPVHGLKANEKGLYKWGISFDRPYKVRCPFGGEGYPSNDFAAFLASGMKDRSLLTGEYADDGWGWQKPGQAGNYWFVAYWAHWIMLRELLPAITNLGLATVMAEGDDPTRAKLYAHKCALLLWQFAEYYPDYAYNKQSREGKEHNPNYTGKITNMIWEVQTPEACAPAYDAVRPYLDGDEDLQRLSGLHGAALEAHIRERLLLEAARCITDGSGRIAGNYGAHQRALMTLATVLQETEQHPTTNEMLEYVISNPRPKTSSDLGLQDALLNLVYRDGMPMESIGYNYGWVSNLAHVAAAAAQINPKIELPRFDRFLTWPYKVLLPGGLVPPLGDTGDFLAHGQGLDPAIARLAVAFTHDPRVVKTVLDNPGAEQDLFMPEIGKALADMPSDSNRVDPWPLHFPAYGLAFLQQGEGNEAATSALFYGDYPCHVHYDQLNLLLFAHGNALLTDIGYPEQTDAFNHRRFAFFSNTVAHNTVVVNARRQGRGPGRLWAYQPRGFAQVVDASCEGAYPGVVSLYRRANMLVQVAPGQSYLFDVFYVRGGTQHDFVTLGPPAEVSCEPPLGPVQTEGTLAGTDVPLEHFYDDANLASKPLGEMSYTGYTGSGFQFLFNVRRGPLQEQALCEWRVKQPSPGGTPYPWEGRSLRAHVVGADQELISCDARPQRYSYLPETVQFLLRRRVGSDLRSCFTTVYEPVLGQPIVRRVLPVRLEPDDGDAVALCVELQDGGTHYVFHSLHPEREYRLDDAITVSAQAACLALEADGGIAGAMLLNGTELRRGDFAVQSVGLRRTRIKSVDYARGIIELEDPVLEGNGLAGQSVLIEPEGFAESVAVGSVVNSTHLAIGDQDLRAGGGPVTQVLPAESRLTTPVNMGLVQPGMTVVNALMQPQGRLGTGPRVTLERGDLGPLRPEDFPPAPGSTTPRFYVMAAGPGDEVVIPSLVSFVRER